MIDLVILCNPMQSYCGKLSALGMVSSVTELSLANGKRESEAIIILLLAKIFVLQRHQCTAQLLVRSIGWGEDLRAPNYKTSGSFQVLIINYKLYIATVTTSQRYSITVLTP